METILLVIHLVLAVALIGVVLLQKSEGGGLGIGGGGGGGGMSGFMTGRGSANLLTRATAILAACFMVTSLGLAWLVSGPREPASIFDTPAAVTEEPAEAQPLQEPAAPVEPAEPQSSDPSVPLGQ
jgi:preprotein translocase subunit SecG